MEKKLGGKTLQIAFNLATEITYERMTNHAFDYAAIFGNGDPNFIPKQSDIADICCACLMANNIDTFEINDFLMAENREEVSDVIHAIMDAMVQWLAIPVIAEAHVNNHNENGGNRPNS